MLHELYMSGLNIMPLLKIFKVVILAFMLFALFAIIIKILGEKANFKVFLKPLGIITLLCAMLGYFTYKDIANENRFNQMFNKFIPEYKGYGFYNTVRDYDITSKVRVIRMLYNDEYMPKVAEVRNKLSNYMFDARIQQSNDDLTTLAMLAVDTNIKDGLRKKMPYTINKRNKGGIMIGCRNVLNAAKQCNQYLTFD